MLPRAARRRDVFRLGAAAVASVALPSVFAQGDAFPTKTIRLILPAAAGGTADAVSRMLGDPLAKRLGQNVVIDNRTGAAGILGTEIAMNAPPDGHTLLVGTAGAMAVNPSLYRKLPYDPVRSFEPVAILAYSPLLLVAHPSIPAKTIGELVTYVKGKPGVAYASAGSGSTPHLAGELFRLMTGADVMHVPYKGSAPGVTAVMAGEVGYMFTGISSVLGQVKAGKLRALSLGATRRSAALPDVPIASESGLPDFVTDFWYGLFAPAQTPRRIVAQINAALNDVLKDPEVRDKLVGQGSEAAGGTPEQLAALLRKDMDRWAGVVKASNMKVD
ncbi:Bug family tripartite tricarboxylate transporter substrate binding protein [Ramlibacter sp.]|uniref:Bug family tripartite tricarboxylate transporter substrate binding protein n=1 Tax=Ramlibacter sp. TaxID=1917967 RepID=UPI003D0F6BFA